MADEIQAVVPQLELTILGPQSLPMVVSWDGGPAGQIPADVGSYLKSLLVNNPNSRSILLSLTNIEVSRAGVFADISFANTTLEAGAENVTVPVTLQVNPDAEPGPITVNLVVTAQPATAASAR